MQIKKGYFICIMKFIRHGVRINPLFSNNFKADITLMVIEMWFLGVLDTYLFY